MQQFSPVFFTATCFSCIYKLPATQILRETHSDATQPPVTQVLQCSVYVTP